MRERERQNLILLVAILFKISTPCLESMKISESVTPQFWSLEACKTLWIPIENDTKAN
jgi:hypothetical protein